MFNTIIGASVFGIPSLLASHLGALSVPGYLVAAAGVAIVAACLAEVASQFREAGGPYLYARTAFGPFVAIQIGWMAVAHYRHLCCRQPVHLLWRAIFSKN